MQRQDWVLSLTGTFGEGAMQPRSKGPEADAAHGFYPAQACIDSLLSFDSFIIY